jgi:hypothetical protein
VRAPDEMAGVKELTIEEFLLAMLRRAEEDLRRNCVDGLVDLVEYCRHIPQKHAEHVPPEVVAFLRLFFKPGRDGRLRFKQPLGMASFRRRFLRWQRDPNYVAAALYAGAKGKPRERLRHVVETVNAQPYYLKIGKKADPVKVGDLLRHGRGGLPVGPWEDPENDWKN